MAKEPFIQTLDNGLTVIVEEMTTVRSAAYSLIVPAGMVHDDASNVGASLILSELTTKGAGNYSSRQLSEAFDNIGARHSESSSTFTASYAGVLLSENLNKALDLVSLMVRKPLLPEDELPSIKSLLLQDIRSLKDNPGRLVIEELSSLYYPAPYNRPSHGSEEGIKNSSIDVIKKHFQRSFTPQQAILSVAGNVKASEVTKLAEKLFRDWTGPSTSIPKLEKFPKRKMHHIQQEAAQLQIALAYPSVKFGEPLYYTSRIAADILSGGMFGRLFIEVREKRGLCYTVYLSTSSTAINGVTLAYAGTTPERAQETLDVMIRELRDIKGTIKPDELARSKANIKASLVMSEESSASRASSNASDWWWLKRVRSLDEIQDGIQNVAAADLDSYFSQYPCNDPMVVTLGSKKLSLS